MKCIGAKVLGLFFVALIVGAIAAGPAAAAEPTGSADGEAAEATNPFTVEPFNLSDCPAGKACFWEGSTYGGNRAFYPEAVGCHNAEGVDIHSYYNHMYGNWYVRFLETPQYYEWILWSPEHGSGHITGAFCINHL